jgi:hypothetical protein
VRIVNAALEGRCSEFAHADPRPAAVVECPGRNAKGRRGASEPRFPTAGHAGKSVGKGSDGMKPENALSRYATIDPLPQLVESRFRLLTECGSGKDQNHGQANDRRVVQFRTRRLDERIITTVATSAEGLLAQLRLLALFYDESLNGAGRRGSLLIQTIAAGIEQIDRFSWAGFLRGY